MKKEPTVTIPEDGYNYDKFTFKEFEQALKNEPLIYVRKSTEKMTLYDILWALLVQRVETYTTTDGKTFSVQCTSHRNRSREDVYKALKWRFPLITFEFCHGVVHMLYAQGFITGNFMCGTIHRKVYYGSKIGDKATNDFIKAVKQYRKDKPWK